MNKTRIAIFALLVSGISQIPQIYASGFEIMKKDSMELDLDTRIAFLCSLDISNLKTAAFLETAKTSLSGKITDLVDFEISADVYVPENDPGRLAFALDDAYARLSFADFARLTCGRFKIPFGYESTMSLGERPYAERTNTTRDLVPERDIGIEASGKKIAGLFGYELGIWSGHGFELPGDTVLSFLGAGKAYINYEAAPILSLVAGYNAYYLYYKSGVSNHRIAQGAFCYAEITPASSQKITLLAEYDERLSIRSVINQNLDWARGIIGLAGYRAHFIEPYVLCELYDPSMTVADKDDILGLTIGLCFYFFEEDLIRLKLFYSLEAPLVAAPQSHKVSLLVQMEY